LIILYCGNYIKYGRLVPKPESDSRPRLDYVLEPVSSNRKHTLKSMDCIFDEQVEIIKLIETTEEDCVQILNKNYEKNIITVVTWDFKTNSEKNCYQLSPDLTADIE
jgi:hypothetical protein